MIRRLIARAVKIFWLLPGFLLWASFPPMGEKTDCLFALAPLLYLVRTADTRRNVRVWFVNGFLFWFATLSWMPAIVKNGGPWPLVVLGWGALAAYCALYFGAFGYLASKFWQWAGKNYALRIVGLLFVEPILWAGLELVRSRFGGGFSWNQLGVAPINAHLGWEAASLGGVYLVSAMVILVNGTIASIAERMIEPFLVQRRRKRELLLGDDKLSVEEKPAEDYRVSKRVRTIETVLPFLVIWGLVTLGDRCRERTPQPADPGCRTISVALMQRNFPCVFKGPADDGCGVYANMMQHVAPLKPDLVVLSESALSEFGWLKSREATDFVRMLRITAGAKGVIAGGGRFDGKHEYNSAACFTEGAIDVYDKVHLVPFGEFIPGDKLFPVLQRFAPVGSCTPGTVKTIGGGDLPRMGTMICFEDTDSALAREFAAKGAQMLVFITNDSWFSNSDETEQHAWQAVARSVETGLPIVRVGNSGVTGVIRPNASAQWLLDANGYVLVDAKGTMVERITYRTLDGCSAPYALLHTPYVLLGDWPLGIAFTLILLSMILIKLIAYEKRRKLSL